MVQPATKRHRGFAPHELSRLLNANVLREHAEEAAMKWLLRARASASARYHLLDLARLDEKLDAHLDGLRIAGLAGLDVCCRLFEDQPGPGEVFPLVVLACWTERIDLLEPCLAALDDDLALAAPLGSALGWLEWPAAWPLIDRLWCSGQPHRRLVALAAMAYQLRDPSGYLPEALAASLDELRIRAARVIGELGMLARASELRPLLAAPQPALRLAAARSLLLLGARDQDLAAVLDQLAMAGDPSIALAAARLIMRVVPESAALPWFERALQQGRSFVAIAGAGAQGRPALALRLLALLDDDALSPAAAAELALALGLDVQRDDLEAERSPADDEGNEHDEHDEHDSEAPPQPDARLVRAWWDEHAERFTANQRYLAGHPITAENLALVLARGNQVQRQAAALELALARPGTPMHRTARSGVLQAAEFLGWS